MVASSSSFTFYRLHSGRYAGLRIRDVWRHDPVGLVAAAQLPTTDPSDARMIGLFLILIGAAKLMGLTQPTCQQLDQHLAQKEAARTTSATARARVVALPRDIGLYTRLDEMLGIAEERRESVVTACFTLDDFAALQAQLGRAEAGYVLGIVTARLIGKIGDRGTVGQLDESRPVALTRLALGQMSPEAIRRGATAHAEMLREAIAMPVATKQGRMDITVRVGIAVAPVDGIDAHDLLVLAAANAASAASRASEAAPA